jgi:hypothetical protein
VAAFDDLISSLGPQGASAWGTISSQLAAEGADQPAVVAAQNTFTTAWNNLSTTFQMDPDSALTGAQQYTYAASTIGGAVSMVQGLGSEFRQIATPAGAIGVANMFAGSMVGLAVAAGAVSAGVGAVIVAAAEIAGTILAGILGQPPGVEICPGINANPTPNWVINCTAVWGKSYSPGQAGWRKFPSAPEWFTNGSMTILQDGYTGANNTLPINLNLWTAKGDPSNSPIGVLFPDYNHVVGPAPADLANFHTAFIAAWKANKEYALNGQKPQDDAVVLQHCILVWNRAHLASSTTNLNPMTASYEGTLVASAISQSSAALQAENYIDGSGFTINTGSQRYFPQAPPSVSTQITIVPTTAAAPTSTAKKVVGVTAAAAGSITLTAIVWSLATGKAWDWALGQAWSEIKDMIGGSSGGLAEERRNRRRGGARRRSSGTISRRRR